MNHETNRRRGHSDPSRVKTKTNGKTFAIVRPLGKLLLYYRLGFGSSEHFTLTV